MRKSALPVLHDAVLLRKIAHVWVALAGAFCLFDQFSGAYLALHQRAAEIYHWPASAVAQPSATRP